MKRIVFLAGVAGLALVTPPARAVEPVTVAATLSTIGSVLGAFASGPDLATAYSVETYRLLEQTNARLSAIEDTLAGILTIVADSERDRQIINRTLDIRNRTQVEAAFEQLNLAYGDTRISEDEREDLRGRRQELDIIIEQMRQGDPFIVAPSLTLYPFYRLAIDEAIIEPRDYSSTQAKKNVDYAIRQLEKLIDPERENSLTARKTALEASAHQRFAGWPDAVIAAIGAASADFYEARTAQEIAWTSQEPMIYPPISDEAEFLAWSYREMKDEVRRVVVSCIPDIGKSVRGEKTEKSVCIGQETVRVFDYNNCGFGRVRVTLDMNTASQRIEFLTREERRRCPNQNADWASTDAGPRDNWHPRAEALQASFDLYEQELKAVFFAEMLTDNVHAGIDALKSYDPDSVVAQLRAEARSQRTLELRQNMIQTADASYVEAYIREMERRRDATNTLIASSRSRLDALKAEAAEAAKLQQIAGMFAAAGSLIRTADAVAQWLEEQGYISGYTADDIPDPSVITEPEPRRWDLQDERELELRRLQGPGSTVRSAEALTERLRTAPVAVEVDRMEFVALATLEALAQAPAAQIRETLNLGRNVEERAAQSFWDLVDKKAKALLSVLAPTAVGDSDLYGAAHRKLVASRLMQALADRQERRARLMTGL